MDEPTKKTLECVAIVTPLLFDQEAEVQESVMRCVSRTLVNGIERRLHECGKPITITMTLSAECEPAEEVEPYEPQIETLTCHGGPCDGKVIDMDIKANRAIAFPVLSDDFSFDGGVSFDQARYSLERYEDGSLNVGWALRYQDPEFATVRNDIKQASHK